MKTAIVYYSLSGNAKYVAEKIAENLDGDLIRLETVKSYEAKGLGTYFIGGKAAVSGESPKLKPYAFNGDDYDQVILCSPVWAMRIAPALKTFIEENKDNMPSRIGMFMCQMGSGAEKAMFQARWYLGIESFIDELVIIDPLKNKNEENENKINEFCESFK